MVIILDFHGTYRPAGPPARSARKSLALVEMTTVVAASAFASQSTPTKSWKSAQAG